jgi:hypothetical protein
MLKSTKQLLEKQLLEKQLLEKVAQNNRFLFLTLPL